MGQKNSLTYHPQFSTLGTQVALHFAGVSSKLVIFYSRKISGVWTQMCMYIHACRNNHCGMFTACVQSNLYDKRFEREGGREGGRRKERERVGERGREKEREKGQQLIGALQELAVVTPLLPMVQVYYVIMFCLIITHTHTHTHTLYMYNVARFLEEAARSDCICPCSSYGID